MYIMIILYRFLHVMLAYYFNSKGHSSVNYEIRIFILQAFGFVFIRIRKAFPFGHFCWLNVYERISKNHVNDVVSHLYYDLSIIAIFVLLDCRKIMYNIISDDGKKSIFNHLHFPYAINDIFLQCLFSWKIIYNNDGREMYLSCYESTKKKRTNTTALKCTFTRHVL